MLKERHRVLVLATFIVFMASLSSIANSQVSFIAGPAAISTGHDEETSCVVVDDEGNAHVVWASVEGSYLFYMMVDKDGIILIDETNLNPCTFPDTYHVRRPSIALDPSGGLHIVFHGWSLYTDLGATEYEDIAYPLSSEIIYTKINPYDYYEGGESDINDLIVIPETIISTEDDIKSRAPNVALDPSNSRLHVVWYEGNDSSSLSINYLVLDLDGNAITPETSLTSGLQLYVAWGEPEIALDPDGNAHIVYCHSTLGEPWPYDDREIYYTMVTVTGGLAITLIDDTEITVADGHASCRPHLGVDSEGMVHVVWHDKWLFDTAAGEHEIFYSKLDPSLDDQDGDSSDSSEISVISEVRISSNNSKRSNQKNVTIDEHDRIHVTWSDGDEYEQDRDVYYALFDSSGDILTIVEPETVVMSGGDGLSPITWWYSSGRHPEIFTYCDRVYITFNVFDDLTNMYSDIYLTILSVPTLPAIPLGLSASDGAYTDRIEVSWDSVTCTDEYIVNRSDSASDYGDEIAYTADTSYTDDDPSLIPDTRYYYWIRAYNSFGSSDFSDSDSGYVLAISDEGNGKKDCFIATAAYGSALHPYVSIFREFRDRYLKPSRFGSAFIKMYYKYSPFVANFIAKHRALRVAVRIGLLPIVVVCYSMLHFGPAITTTVIFLILFLPVFIIWRHRRKLRHHRRRTR